MINRQNWLTINTYLQYLSQVLLQSEDTVSRRREQLRHFLEWADSKNFNQICNINPVFPVYLLTARNDGKKHSLSDTTIKKTCETSQRFLKWGKINEPRKFSNVTPAWIDTIRPARHSETQIDLPIHDFFTLEEIEKIANLDLDSLRDIRDQAAVCFMFLSGMRVGAFVSLPINCINLKSLRINQFPNAGVLTKNRKSAQTSLYRIPKIINRVIEWDIRVRSSLPEDSAWYSAIDRIGTNLVPVFSTNSNRSTKVNSGIFRLCEMTKINYRSSHKLRHGHVIFGIKNVRDMEGLKAVSMNVMHSSVEITDRVYGGLTSDDINEVISNLQPKSNREEVDQELVKKLADLADILKSNPNILELLKKDES